MLSTFSKNSFSSIPKSLSDFSSPTFLFNSQTALTSDFTPSSGVAAGSPSLNAIC